jgi:ADP-heptose:LPS heptosyltransferase
MSPGNIVKHRSKRRSSRYRYGNRLLRAVALRLLLHLCLPLWAVEKRLNPVPGDGRKRILVIVIGGMGDCLLFDPLFRRLKEHWPQACIDVLTGSFEQMWSQMESVDNLVLFKPTKFKPPWAYVRLFRTIFRRSYDIVAEGIAMVPKRGIYPLLTAYIMQASRAPVRIGRRNTGRLEALWPRRLDFIGPAEIQARKAKKLDRDTNPYLSHTIDVPPPHGRESHESAYIFSALNVPFKRHPDEPRLLPDDSADQWARTMLRDRWGSPADRLIGITVETTRQIKAWPLESFAHIMESAVRDGYKFVMLGLDRQRAAHLSQRFATDAVINLAGRTDLAQMIGLIRQCDLFVSCDTGPAHVAQACRIPTVVLFGPSNEKEFGPVDPSLHAMVLPPQSLGCRPCVLGPCVRGQSCMQMIQPQSVYQAMKKVMAGIPGGAGSRVPKARMHPQRRLCEI